MRDEIKDAIVKEIGGWLRKNDETPSPCSCNRYITDMLLHFKDFVQRQFADAKLSPEASELVRYVRDGVAENWKGCGVSVDRAIQLADALESAESRCQCYKSALEWYADNCSGPGLERQWMRTPTYCVARAALSEVKG
jgi:hypothetical protein